MAAARTVTPTATASPAFTMDPTSTEHDYRFPRRPTGRDNAHRLRDNGEIRSSLQQLNAELGGSYDDSSSSTLYGTKLLGPALFPLLQSANADSDQSLEQAQQDDPLATQVWKFFARAKQQQPNHNRMENLTWRMMAVGMRRHKEEMQRRYDTSSRCTLLHPIRPSSPVLLATRREQ